MKPDWSKAPKWAKYLTQDPDGSWYWHDEKPEFFGGRWSSPYQIFAGRSDFEPIVEARP